MNVKITKESLLPLLIYNSPIKYDEYITIYPVTMRDVITFQFLESSITLRKNSIFREKKIIKMTGKIYPIHKDIWNARQQWMLL